MTHIPFESSLLASAAYDPATQTCEVLFAKGGRYQYRDFPAEKWEQFRSAESQGKFFLAEVKGKHEFTKIVEEEASDDDGA